MRFLLLFVTAIGVAAATFAQPRWQRIAQSTTNDLLRASFLDSTTGWVCGRNGVILHTSDGGRNWIPQQSTVTSDLNDIVMLNRRIGYALSWVYYQDDTTYYGSKLLKTTNGGITWHAREFSPFGKYFHTVTFFDSLNGWVGGEEGGIYRTADGGGTWERALVDSSFHMNFAVLNINFMTRTYGFAMGGAMDFAGVVWRTTNGGERWTAFGISPEPVYEIRYIDSLYLIGIAGDFDFGASMVRSLDGGERWEWIYLEHFGQPRAMSWRTNAEAWVPIGNRLLYTRDTAKTWQVTETFGWRTFYDLVFVDSLTGYAVTDSGFVYKYIHSVTSVDAPANSLPKQTQLHPNYPNPFNPSTTISFSLASVSFVDVAVYDVLGRRVATLMGGEKEAGTFLTSWDAREVPSGVYFCRLTVLASDGKPLTFTRKLMLVK